MTSRPPKWIKPQLTRLVDEAPGGDGWLHEVKYDGYRMHARIDGPDIKLLTRTGLDWSGRYRRTIEALRELKVKSAYLDGELCALNADGVPVFSRLQAAMDEDRTDQLVFFAFDLLFLNGESTVHLPLIERKERLQRLFKKEVGGLRYSEHVAGDGPLFSSTRLPARSRRRHFKASRSTIGTKKVPYIGAHTLFSIMTTEPNGVVEPIHEKPSLLGRRTQ
jgi:ATP-dependent DNA ligase